MANPFDQFDQPAGNPFDQFDSSGVQSSADASSDKPAQGGIDWRKLYAISNPLAAPFAIPAVSDFHKIADAGVVSGAGSALAGVERMVSDQWHNLKDQFSPIGALLESAKAPGPAIAKDAALTSAMDELRASVRPDGTSAVSSALLSAGEAIKSTASPELLQAMENSRFEGDALSPSTWGVSDDASLLGFAGNLTETGGQMLPIVGAGMVNPAAGAAVAAGQSAEGAYKEAADYLKNLPVEQFSEIPRFKELVAEGVPIENAHQIVIDEAGSGAMYPAAAVGSLSGPILGGTVTRPLAAILEKRFGQGFLSRLYGNLAEVPLEGAQEGFESAAGRAGANTASGDDRSLTEGTFGDVVMGGLAAAPAAVSHSIGQIAAESSEDRIRKLADVVLGDREVTPESNAVEAGRNAAAAIFGDAGISNDTGQPIPDPRIIDFTQAVDPETGLPPIGVQPEVMGDLDAMVPSEPEAAPDPVRPAVEPVAQPAQETQGKSIPGLSEPIRSGTRVFYPGDVDAMRAKLDAAGLDAGMRRNNEDGTPAGLYFPARMQAEVDAVLRPKVPAPVAAQETAVPEPPAYQGQKIPPPRKQRNQVRSAKDFDPNYHDIRDFIALNGGLDFGAFKSEFKSEIPDDNVRFFGKPLFRKNGGMKPDQLRERLQEAGFLNEDSPDAPPQYTQQDAYDLVDRALDGNPVYHPAGVDVQNQLRANNEYDAEQERRQAYIDEHGVTPELDSEFADRAAALDRGDLERMYSKRAKDRTATPDMFGATQRAQTSPAPRPASGDLFGSPTSSERLDAAQRDSDARLTGPAIGMRQGEGELFAGQRPRQETIPSRSNSTPSDPTSWILRDKETGKAVMETTDRRKVDALNTNKYEAVSAERHMQEVNTKGTLAYAAARGSEIKRSQRPDTQGIEVDEATPTPEEMAAFNRQVDNRQRQPENRANDAQRLPADTGLVRRPADGTTAPERAGMVSARGNRDSQSSARQVSPAADAKPDLTGQPPKFGQWFRQSKMKDAKARPMEFHHATDADFDTFDAGKRGSSTGFAPTGLGNWFSQDAGAIKGYGSKVLSGHLRLENPKVMDSHELPDLESKADYEALAKKYKVEGYDGLYFPDSKQAVAFDSVQFKENRNSGEYSESPNIYRSQHADNQSETPQAKDAKDSKDAGKLKETSNTASEPKRLFIPEVKAAKESPEQVTTKKARPEELIEARKRRGNLRQLLDCLNA